MNRDDIIRMAHEAGLGDGLLTGKSVDGESGIWINLMSVRSVLERFAALVAAAEREACAMVCQKYGDYIRKNDKSGYADLACISCATGIRARGRK